MPNVRTVRIGPPGMAIACPIVRPDRRRHRRRHHHRLGTALGNTSDAWQRAMEAVIVSKTAMLFIMPVATRTRGAGNPPCS